VGNRALITSASPEWVPLSVIYHHVLAQYPAPEAAKIAISEGRARGQLRLRAEVLEHEATPDLKLDPGKQPPEIQPKRTPDHHILARDRFSTWDWERSCATRRNATTKSLFKYMGIVGNRDDALRLWPPFETTAGTDPRHWACSLRQIAKCLDRPAAAIPARWPAVRISIARLHHARLGTTAKTLANHRSNVRAALRWFGKEQSVPQQGARLSPEWARFLQQLERSIRQRLYNLVRYCSARCIGPTSVDDALFDEYWRYRAENTGRAMNNTAKRFMVRAWNGCLAAMDGLPLQRLTEPPIKTAEPPWENFLQACAGTSMTTWLAFLSRTAHATTSGFSLAAPQQLRTGGPSLSRSAARPLSSACRSRASTA
jgi:hypothetical protein